MSKKSEINYEQAFKKVDDTILDHVPEIEQDPDTVCLYPCPECGAYPLSYDAGQDQSWDHPGEPPALVCDCGWSANLDYSPHA